MTTVENPTVTVIEPVGGPSVAVGEGSGPSAGGPVAVSASSAALTGPAALAEGQPAGPDEDGPGGLVSTGLTAADAAMVAADAAASTSSNTRRAYASDWVSFEGWCVRRGVLSLPAAPATVATYLSESSRVLRPDGRAAFAAATLTRWLSAINMTHASAGYAKPGECGPVRAAMAGIRRQRGTRQRRVRPLLLTDLQAVLAALESGVWPGGLAATRDAAVLLTGFAGALRRSELAALTVGDVVAASSDGVHLTVARSKTDQEGRGAVRALPYGANPATCPPCALWRWVELLDLVDAGADRAGVMRWVFTHAARDRHTCMDTSTDVTSDAGRDGAGSGSGIHPAQVDRDGDPRPLFRAIARTGTVVQAAGLSGHAVNELVKRRVAAVGLNPDRFGGHSLRAGFVTEAFRRGQDSHAIRRQTGHQSDAVLETYYREHAPLVGNAVTVVGL